MRFNLKRPVGLLVGLVALGMLVAASSASSYVRPSGGTPIGASLVLAYKQCVTASPATWVHGGTTVGGGACNGDPAGGAVAPSFGRVSTLLTAGEPPAAGASKFKGNVKLVVCNASGASCSPNGVGTQDVLTPQAAAGGTGAVTAATAGNNYLQDVRCGVGLTAAVCTNGNAAGPADYATGAGGTALLKATSNIRITDLGTGDSTAGCTSGVGPRASCPYLGTTVDLDFDVPVICSATADTSIGGFCTTLKTSINNVLPGAVGPAADLLRGNVEVKQIKVTDGGPDANPFIPDAPNSDYAVQGIFLP
jgi:hypothetical protein